MEDERISTKAIGAKQNAGHHQKNKPEGTFLAAYQKSLETIFSETKSTKDGLDERTVESRQAEHGFNELGTKERDSVLKLFIETFQDAMVLVLLAVAAIQMGMGHAAESLIIFAVLMINAVVSVIQTRKAEGSLDALKSLSAPMAKVKRDGARLTIPARELVVGDIVSLDAGDYVPADGRLIEASSLKVDEAMLTGESLPADKEVKDINGAAPIGDRSNMVHSGTLTVYGRGEFVVTSDHYGLDAGLFGILNCGVYCFAGRIDHRHEPDQNQIVLYIKIKHLFFIHRPVGKSQHAKGAIREMFVLLLDFFQSLFRQRQHLTVAQHFGTAPEYDIRSALSQKQTLAVDRMDR